MSAYLSCIFCNQPPDQVDYLFLSCVIAFQVCEHFFLWIGISLPSPSSIQHLFVLFLDARPNLVIKGAWTLLWHNMIWNLWVLSNGAIFKH